MYTATQSEDTMSKHTPAPWSFYGDSNLAYFKAEDGSAADLLRTVDTTERSEADIRHAIHCVNSHAALVEALWSMRRRAAAQEDAMREAGIWTDEDEHIAALAHEQARAALALARGE